MTTQTKNQKNQPNSVTILIAVCCGAALAQGTGTGEAKDAITTYPPSLHSRNEVAGEQH